MHYIAAFVLFLPIIFCGNAPQNGTNVATSPMTLTVTSPRDYQIFQRDANGLADIVITGTYTGSPAAIEASWNGGDYETIDGSPGGGTFSGTLPDQPGGQGTLTVRFIEQTSFDTVAFVGVGDVYLVAGQSNAAGHGDNNQTYTHATLKAAMYKRSTNTWAELADPAGGEGGSPWMHLATLHMASEGVPVGFITTAVDGSGLNSDGDWEKGGGQYNNALAWVTGSKVNTVRAILWHQGSAEINSGETQESYQTALSQMLDDMQADNAALAGVPLMAAQIGYKTTSGSTRTEIDPIRLAIADRWDNDPDILAGPVLYDIDLSDGDGVHFGSGSDSELTTLAQRWWRMLRFYFYGGSEGRAHKFSGAGVVGNQVVVTFSGGFGSLTGQDDITGWRVTNNGAPVTVLSASARGSNKVVLALGSLPTGVVAVSYGSGNDGAGGTLKDSGSIPLPPEPFSDEPALDAIDPGVTLSVDYDPAFDFFVDIEDASGNKLGSGPLQSLEFWEYTAKMDRAGSFSFQCAATDAQAEHVTNRRIARAWALLNGIYREMGAGVIDDLDISPDDEGLVSMSARGLDLIRELSFRNVGNLEVGTTNGTTHAVGVTSIGALAPPGWSFEAAADPTNNYIYARYAGESVLGAFLHLAERTQTHFYRATGRELVFTSEFEPTYIRAVQAGGDLAAQTCAIVRLRRTVVTHELLTRIYPFGSGQGDARLTLHATTRSAPAGYTLNKALNYIENDAATVLYGLVDHPQIEFKEITPISNTDADVVSASNMLFDAALAELEYRSSIASQEIFDLVISGCSQLLRPMQTIRVVYRDPDQGIDINQELYILEATWRVDEEGVHTTRLVVSTHDRWPLSDTSVAVERAAQGRIFQAHPQMGPNSYWENSTLFVGADQATHIAEFPFVLGNEVVTVQQVRLRFKVAQVLSFTSVSAGSADVEVAVDVDVDVDVDVTVGGTIDISHSHPIPDHQHSITVAGSSSPPDDLLISVSGGTGFLAKASAGDVAINTNVDSGATTSDSGGSESLSLPGTGSGSGTGTGTGTGVLNLADAIEIGYGVYQAPAARTFAIGDLEYRVNNAATWESLDTADDVGGGYFELDITPDIQNPNTFRPVQENNLIEIRRKNGAGEIDLEHVSTFDGIAAVSTNPTPHGLTVGEEVTFAGTGIHDGTWVVTEITSAVTFKTTAAPGADNSTTGAVLITKSAMIYAKLGVRTTIQATALT